MTVVNHWIGGRPYEAAPERRGQIYNPATGERQAEVALGSAREVDRAVAAAKEAFAGWSSRSLSRRTEVLFRFRERFAAAEEELAKLIVAEHGKVLEDARGEVRRGLEVADFACGIPQLLKGSVLGERLHGRRQLLDPATAGCGGGADAVQLPGHGADVDDADCDRVREHVRAEAFGEGSVGVAADRGALA